MRMFDSMSVPAQLWSCRSNKSWSMLHRDSWPSLKGVYSVHAISILSIHSFKGADLSDAVLTEGCGGLALVATL
jgi:hypothetical protein